VDTQLLTIANNVGGWVFATVAITTGAFVIIRWLMAMNDRLVVALERLTASMDSLTDEVRASRRR
jgi:hypothetical protein